MTAAEQDRGFMLEAVAEAEHGRYSAAPNPAVGCVLVRDGAIIARGFHARAGEAHAEVAALAAVGGSAVGATAYVTLEPCNHHGRTGPCVDALLAAGIARVVYAEADPSAHAGGGAARLSAAGVAVEAGCAVDAASGLNRGFFQRLRLGRPRVRVKLAMSLDGGAALADGQSQWITGAAARADVQRLRAESCAIITGIGTVLADDPGLNVRDPRFEMRGRQPMRVVLDSQLRMPGTARMLSLAGETRVFTTRAADQAAGAFAAGVRLERMRDTRGGLDLGAVVQRLAELECNEVLVEAGPTLASRFIAERRFDELLVYVAPKLLGREARRAFDLASPLNLSDALGLRLDGMVRIGDDIALTLLPPSG